MPLTGFVRRYGGMNPVTVPESCGDGARGSRSGGDSTWWPRTANVTLSQPVTAHDIGGDWGRWTRTVNVTLVHPFTEPDSSGE